MKTLKFFLFFLCLPLMLSFAIFLFAGTSWMTLGSVSLVFVGYIVAIVRVSAAALPRWAGISGLVIACMGWVATAFLGIAITFGHQVYRHISEGTPACWVPDNFSQMLECDGRDSSFLQGRLFYHRTVGTPKQDICQQFFKYSKDGKTEDCKGPRDFRTEDCAAFGIASDYTCFTCSHISSSFDRYFTLYAFDINCERAIAYHSANMELEEIPEALKKKP